MSILNRPSDGLLSVLIALRSGLLAYGPKPEAELLSRPGRAAFSSWRREAGHGR